MPEGKAKFIRDAQALIDRRVELLEAELASEYGQRQCDRSKACDRAAILEAKHLSRLIGVLAEKPYRKHPYDVASGRLGYTAKIE